MKAKIFGMKRALGVAVSVAFFAAASSANATVPAWVTTLATDTLADIGTIVTAVSLCIGAVVGFSLLTKVAKKIIAKI